MLIRKLLTLAAFFIAVSVPLVSSSAPVFAEDSGGSVQVQTLPGPTLTQVVETRIHDSWPWYIIRASGIVAAVCLIILLLSGIGFITGHTYKLLPPLTGWATHRSIGITAGIAVLIHMFGLLFDHYAPFTILQILVPWVSDYKPATIFGLHLGSFYVAVGVFAFYAMLAIIVTSLVWVERKPHTWKLIHFLSYLVMVLIFVHALFLGTDMSHGIMRMLWIALSVVVGLASLSRLWRARTL